MIIQYKTTFTLSKLMSLYKIAALDLGDEWTGIAISDSSQTFARPYETIPAKIINKFLTDLFTKEEISRVIVGHPRTMKGTASLQTLAVEKIFEELKITFPQHEWVLWDERLSSRRAAQTQIGKKRSKEERRKEHAIAAAFILDSYLTFLKAQQDQ